MKNPISGTEAKGFVLQPRDIEVIKMVYALWVVPFSTLQSHFFPKGAQKNAYYRINRLAELGYIHRFDRGQLAYHNEALYMIGRNAKHILANSGQFETLRFPRTDRPPSLLFLDHHLHLVRLIPHFLQSPPGIKVWTYMEPHIRTKVTLKGKQKHLWPDGLLVFFKNGKKAVAFLEMEISRHTQKWKDKVVKYETYWRSGAFAEDYAHLGTQSFVVLALCQQGEGHVSRLKMATENVTRTPIFFFLSTEDLTNHSAYGPVWWCNDGFETRRRFGK